MDGQMGVYAVVGINIIGFVLGYGRLTQRVKGQEKLNSVQFDGVNGRLDRIERKLDKMNGSS